MARGSTKACNGLTLKEEAFCQAFVRLGMPSAAYREAYDAEKSSPEVIAVDAQQVLNRDRVKARIAELREETAAHNEVTRAEIVSKLRLSHLRAMEASQYSAATNAAVALGKMNGFFIDVRETRKAIPTQGEVQRLLRSFYQSMLEISPATLVDEIMVIAEVTKDDRIKRLGNELRADARYQRVVTPLLPKSQKTIEGEASY